MRCICASISVTEASSACAAEAITSEATTAIVNRAIRIIIIFRSFLSQFSALNALCYLLKLKRASTEAYKFIIWFYHHFMNKLLNEYNLATVHRRCGSGFLHLK